MTLLLILAILLPWSIWRQMHPHELTGRGLVKLPAIFAIIGVGGFGGGAIPLDGRALAYIAASLALSVGFGVWRGLYITIWRDASGRLMSMGNRLTLTLWGTLIATKVAMAAVASITGIFPGEHSGEVFLFLAVSFVAQNLVIAERTLWRAPHAATW